MFQSAATRNTWAWAWFGSQVSACQLYSCSEELVMYTPGPVGMPPRPKASRLRVTW